MLPVPFSLDTIVACIIIFMNNTQFCNVNSCMQRSNLIIINITHILVVRNTLLQFRTKFTKTW